MKITAQEEYGVRCLLRLARAGEPLTIPEIAAGEGLSQPYAGKLLAVLKNAGLIESERGRTGGYRLARPPEETTLGSVMSALGDRLFDGADFCQRYSGTETNGSCVHQTACGLRGVWNVLDQWTGRVLDQITLADLMHGEKAASELARAHLNEVARHCAELNLTNEPLEVHAVTVAGGFREPLTGAGVRAVGKA